MNENPPPAVVKPKPAAKPAPAPAPTPAPKMASAPVASHHAQGDAPLSAEAQREAAVKRMVAEFQTALETDYVDVLGELFKTIIFMRERIDKLEKEATEARAARVRLLNNLKMTCEIVDKIDQKLTTTYKDGPYGKRQVDNKGYDWVLTQLSTLYFHVLKNAYHPPGSPEYRDGRKDPDGKVRDSHRSFCSFRLYDLSAGTSLWGQIRPWGRVSNTRLWGVQRHLRQLTIVMSVGVAGRTDPLFFFQGKYDPLPTPFPNGTFYIAPKDENVGAKKRSKLPDFSNEDNTGF